MPRVPHAPRRFCGKDRRLRRPTCTVSTLTTAVMTALYGARALGVLAVRAAELDHEFVDDPVEVQAIVETALGELDEVAGGDGHLVGQKLDLDVAHGGAQRRDRVGHGAGA